MMLNGKIILNSGDAVVYGAYIANNERDRKEIGTQSDGDTELYVCRETKTDKIRNEHLRGKVIVAPGERRSRRQG